MLLVAQKDVRLTAKTAENAVSRADKSRLKFSDNRLRQPCRSGDGISFHPHLLHPCRSRHQPLMQSFFPGATHIQTYWVPEYVDMAADKLAGFFNHRL